MTKNWQEWVASRHLAKIFDRTSARLIAAHCPPVGIPLPKWPACDWLAEHRDSSASGSYILSLNVDLSSMFRKALPRVISRSRRSLHSSLPAQKVVSTNPVKAQEVPVTFILFSKCIWAESVLQSWTSGKYPLIEHEYDAIVVYALPGFSLSNRANGFSIVVREELGCEQRSV